MASAIDSTEQPPFVFPGFGLPLNYTPQDDSEHALFPNALDAKRMRQNSEYGLSPLTTLREFEMLNFMNEVTDKPDWHLKVFDENITSRWKQEALADEDADMTEKMADWCIAELQYKTQGFQKTGMINAYNDVIKSDSVVSGELKEALKAAVAPLEQVPERLKDWHPHSNNQVLDLVHPSLFPLIYGRSRVLRNDVVGLQDCVQRSGEGVAVPVPPEEENGYELYIPPNHWTRSRPSIPYSTQFQWLPCDVDISEDRAKIMSYINNLHPTKHRNLYSVIEEIISRAIPLWNMTLSPLKHPNFRYKRIEYKYCRYDPDPEAGPKTDGPQQEEDEDEDDFLERRGEWESATRVVVLPEPGPFVPPVCDNTHSDTTKVTGVDLRRDFGDRGLQVIVKLANIHLTPENPEYKGGSWHVEGQLNEHICASAIYYYDSKNITVSKLSFRQQSAVWVDVNYLQNHDDWLEDVYGCVNEEPGVQDCGTVKTPEGRLLTWPNILQHQVQPFELDDRSKPGHRKILAIFLVDPNIRVTSTASVPCQRRDWWSEMLRNGGNAMTRLPVEVQDHIIRDVEEFPISLDEAKDLRLKLMEERAVFVKHYDDAFHQHTFSLCEH